MYKYNFVIKVKDNLMRLISFNFQARLISESTHIYERFSQLQRLWIQKPLTVAYKATTSEEKNHAEFCFKIK